MARAQRVQTGPEGVHDLRHAGARLEPRAHGADESEPRGVRESASPSPFMFDDRAPERDRADDGGRRPCGPRSFEEIERSARVDAALTPDIRCRVCADARAEETGNGASRFARSTRSPMVDARSGRQQARARPILGEVPDTPALDRLIEMRSRWGRGVRHAGPWCSRWTHRARHSDTRAGVSCEPRGRYREEGSHAIRRHRMGWNGSRAAVGSCPLGDRLDALEARPGAICPGERVVRVGCGCARHSWEATAPRGEGETTPSQG